MGNWSGANMRCEECNKYLPDRCTCNGPSLEEQRITKSQVYESLDNAMDNGYDELLVLTPEEIAHDIRDNDAQLEDTKAEHLIPHIKAWLKEKA